MYDTIYVDVDGVLANFTQGVFDLFNYRGDILPGVFELEKSMGISVGQLWDAINKSGVAFWHDLQVYDGSREFIKDLREYAPKVVLLTRCGSLQFPTTIPPCLQGKALWIDDNFADIIDGVLYVVDASKNAVAKSGSCLIDDRDVEVETFDGDGYLLPRVWNKGGVVEDPYRFVLNQITEKSNVRR